MDRWLTLLIMVVLSLIASSGPGVLASAQDRMTAEPAIDSERDSTANSTPNLTSDGTANRDSSVARDWASDFLAEDPLAGKNVIELQDLEDALADENQRAWLIERHFQRAVLSDEQRQAFLQEALSHSDPVVQRQAAEELQRRGELVDLIRRLLLQWLREGDERARNVATIGLQFLRLPQNELDQSILDALLRSLGSDSPSISEAAARQLRQIGASAVPGLLRAMQDANQPNEKAAEVLSQILGGITPPPLLPTTVPDLSSQDRLPAERVTTKAAPSRPSPKWLQRNVDADNAKDVRVYFGTNRELLEGKSKFGRVLIVAGALTLMSFFLLVWLVTHGKPPGVFWLRWMFVRVVSVLVSLGLLFFASSQFNEALSASLWGRSGVQFGPRRSANSTIHYGYCDVSIPPTHSVGEVERPLIGPEDEQEHVVLKQVELLERIAFQEALRQSLSTSGDTSRDGLLFVHGYNVSFDEAAMRAAQIHYDLEFQGVSLFYSWPSRANFRDYFSDRNEIVFSHTVLKQFLEDLLKNVKFDRLHIIAHSMGADAVCQAILELDPQGQVFDQVILAAPDIDAEVFKEQILPRIEQVDRRTTMYCSKNDFALYASKHFNDSPRAGDSSNGPVVAAGLDTVDATDMDTELLGHSYYGNCLRLIDDVRQLIELNRPPVERKLEPFYDATGFPYWTFID